MKTLTILLLFIFNSCQCQKGITYVLVGYENLVDSAYEKILCQEYVDFKDGSKPGMYNVVEYDYGEPPPDQFEIAKSFLTNESICRGWEIKFTKLLEISGWTEGYHEYFVESENNNATNFKKRYTDTLYLKYGMGNYDLELKIKSTKTKP